MDDACAKATTAEVVFRIIWLLKSTQLCHQQNNSQLWKRFGTGIGDRASAPHRVLHQTQVNLSRDCCVCACSGGQRTYVLFSPSTVRRCPLQPSLASTGTVQTIARLLRCDGDHSRTQCQPVNAERRRSAPCPTKSTASFFFPWPEYWVRSSLHLGQHDLTI